MRIADIMWKRISDIEREIKNLKTARFKTAAVISTMTRSGSVTLPLKLFGNPSAYWEIISSKRAIITLTTTDDTNMISSVYLDGVTPTNTDRRFIFIHKLASGNGVAKFAMYVYSQNSNDFDVLSGGGSINVSYSIQGVGSSQFNMNITYEDFDPWS